MLSIGNFFKRIQNKHSKEFFLRTTIAESLQKHLSITVPIESIDISSNTVTLKHVSSVVRSQLFIKKKLLLDEINSKQEIRSILDIK